MACFRLSGVCTPTEGADLLPAEHEIRAAVCKITVQVEPSGKKINVEIRRVVFPRGVAVQHREAKGLLLEFGDR